MTAEPAAVRVDGGAAAVTAVERELESFSYIVSHDLAASFRHVSQFSHLLLGDLGALTDRQQGFADHVFAANSRCQAMMEQLLAFSRIQQKVLKVTRQDATTAVRLALFQLTAEVQSAEADVVVEPLGDIDADADLLALALHHLLDNAIKFRRPGARPQIVVLAAHDAAFRRILITDNGMPVEAAYWEKAFQMFQRLNGEGAFPGVGAGLAICRRIARRHGGEVRFLDHADGVCIGLALPYGLAGQTQTRAGA